MTEQTHTWPLAREPGKVKNPKANAAQQFFLEEGAGGGDGRGGGWVVSSVPFKSYSLREHTLAKLDKGRASHFYIKASHDF